MHQFRFVVTLLASASTLSAQTSAPHPSVDATTRTTIKVADGAYVIRHPDAPNGFPQGNTTVIIGADAVLVVDSGYLPSSAREDIAEIAALTDKPVRYLVNTHWHFDHTFGNGAYQAAFPGLAIVAHKETATQMAGWNAEWLRGYPERTAAIAARLASGRSDDGTALTDADKGRLRDQLTVRERVWREFIGYRVSAPTLLFESDLTIDLGHRVVEIRYLGRGNTTGDAVVVVPDVGVVATGDLFAYPVPYLAGGHPGELVTTLRRIVALGPSVIVPGHGEVQRDVRSLELVAQFVQEVVTVVDRQFFRLGTDWANVPQMQDAVTAAIDLPLWRQRFTGGHPENVRFFDGYSYPELIKAAFAAAWGR